MKKSISKGWLQDVSDCINDIPESTFTLDDIYKYEEHLHELHPNNNYIKDKIRQQLQKLRDMGKIEFLNNNGTYKKIL